MNLWQSHEALAAAETVSSETQAKRWNCDHGINLYSTSGIFQHTQIHTQRKAAAPATITDKTKPVILQSAEKNVVMPFLQHLLLHI